MRTASAVDVAGTRSAPGRRSRRKRAHWAVAWGCDSTRATSPSAEPAPGDQAVVDRVHHLGDDPHAVGLARQRVERGGHAALERVLDRHDRAVGLALLHGHHRLVDGGAGLASTPPGADARSASSV